VKYLLRSFQRRGEFIAAFPVEKMKDDYPKLFTAPLGIFSEFFNCTFANPSIM
jgi:hypothetical protein